MARTAYHHGDLHQQAHDQALAVLRLEGDGAISLRAIAKQIGRQRPCALSPLCGPRKACWLNWLSVVLPLCASSYLAWINMRPAQR